MFIGFSIMFPIAILVYIPFLDTPILFAQTSSGTPWNHEINMKKFSSEVLVALEIFFTAPQLWPPATISEDRLGVSENRR